MRSARRSSVSRRSVSHRRRTTPCPDSSIGRSRRSSSPVAWSAGSPAPRWRSASATGAARSTWRLPAGSSPWAPTWWGGAPGGFRAVAPIYTQPPTERQNMRQILITNWRQNIIFNIYYQAMKAAKMASVSAMEPMLPDDHRHALADLATDLIAKAGVLGGRLHPAMRSNVGDLVRSMNCYYSNLIEGHNTLPADINRALAGDFAEDRQRRNRQLEARAHIEVQRMIDDGHAPSPALSMDFILWVHRTFCERLPDDLLWVENPET